MNGDIFTQLAFFRECFHFRTCQKAQLLQALGGITISRSIQRYLGSAGQQQGADKRLYWFLSPWEEATDFKSRTWWNPPSLASHTSPLYCSYCGSQSSSQGTLAQDIPKHAATRSSQRCSGGRSERRYRQQPEPSSTKETRVSKACPPLEACLDSPSSPPVIDRVKRPTNSIHLGAWSGGKEGRMEEEEEEGSHMDKSVPEKLVHTVRGPLRGWTWRTPSFMLLEKWPGSFIMDSLNLKLHSLAWWITQATSDVETMAEELNRNTEELLKKASWFSTLCTNVLISTLFYCFSPRVLEVRKYSMINWEEQTKETLV